MASATLAALMPAPPTQTRPWTSVPSMVKKRRLGFSIGAGVDAVLGLTSAKRLSRAVARHADAVEPDPAVVDAVEAHLGAVSPRCVRRAAGSPSSRIGTTNACTPSELPPTSSWAKTTASSACAAALPM